MADDTERTARNTKLFEGAMPPSTTLLSHDRCESARSARGAAEGRAHHRLCVAWCLVAGSVRLLLHMHTLLHSKGGYKREATTA